MISIVCLLLIAYCGAAEQDLSSEAKLQRDFDSWCPDSRHLPPGNGTEIHIKFILKLFYFDAGEEVFSIYCWIHFSWTDARFTWRPEDYGGIDSVVFNSLNLWTPMEQLQNVNSDEMNTFWLSSCELKHDGSVFCIPKTILDTTCITKLTDWPYDTQKCRFDFKSKDHTKKFKFTLGERRAMSMIGAEYGGTWNIIDYEQGEDQNATNQLFFELTLERQAFGLGFILATPAIALTLLTMTVPLLDVCGTIRLGIACFSLLSHFTFLQLINYSIPQHNEATPTILIYLRSSLVITSVTIIISVFLNKASEIDRVPPPWLFLWIASGNIEQYFRKIKKLPSATVEPTINSVPTPTQIALI
ncbi:unnamed protein product [Leptosia nina]|uniref:Neurotransmitter-gated ion-channel ligand-binding domain-containing protein n=1 Tax=Leptosia nina TaxID=320188 RepID=A0AAV1IVD6_9NEOP